MLQKDQLLFHLYECQPRVQVIDLHLFEHLELLQTQLCSYCLLEETISLRKQHALKQTPFVPKRYRTDPIVSLKYPSNRHLSNLASSLSDNIHST